MTLGFVLALTASAAAQEVALSATEEGGAVTGFDASNCARCHENPGMRPSLVRDDGLIHSLFVERDRFEQSIHYRKEKQKCVDCHKEGYARFPHNAARSLTCFDCHEKLKPKFEEIRAQALQSVHFTSDRVAFNCAACHTPHYMRPAREMSFEAKNAMCIDCHGGRFTVTDRPLAERHRWHPLAALHLGNTACIACHTQVEAGVSDVAFKHLILPSAQASRACADCHSPDGKMRHYVIDINGTAPANRTDEQLWREFYISGATRLDWLDMGGLALLAFAGLGAFGHGLARALRKGRGRDA